MGEERKRGRGEKERERGGESKNESKYLGVEYSSFLSEIQGREARFGQGIDSIQVRARLIQFRGREGRMTHYFRPSATPAHRTYSTLPHLIDQRRPDLPNRRSEASFTHPGPPLPLPLFSPPASASAIHFVFVFVLHSITHHTPHPTYHVCDVTAWLTNLPTYLPTVHTTPGDSETPHPSSPCSCRSSCCCRGGCPGTLAGRTAASETGRGRRRLGR